MKQILDTISTLPPVFPLACAGDNFGCPDRRPGDTLRVRNPRIILRPTGNSSASRRAATAHAVPPTETYAESSMACSFPPAHQTGAPLPSAASLARRRNNMIHRFLGRLSVPHLQWRDGRATVFSRGVLRPLDQAVRR